MPEIGFFLSSEEHGPSALVGQARAAEEAGFRSLVVSDHYHPWLDRQGQSPFVWSVVGAIAATTGLRVTTGVTCPSFRVHPAVVAQAAATSQLLLDGRFVLGVGSGEALNEHILGGAWPPVPVRLDMLEEAVTVMRRLWEGGVVNHHGRHYTVENARLHSRPDVPPPVVVSAFGPEARRLAARIGDGVVTVQPEDGFVEAYRSDGGTGPAVGTLKVCWDVDEGRARKLAHELWPTDSLPGQLNQDLPTTAHFEQAVSLVTEEMVAEQIPCGPDPERHVAALSAYVDAGFDEIYVNQVGPDQAGFLDFWTRELRPRLGA
jgi:G6PDH family F420-dependent oxidoreductase